MTETEILSLLPRMRALVVGDVCLDRRLLYDPALAEESRETGIPRLAVVASTAAPGAAGAVAANLADLGVGEVNLLGVLGQDAAGRELEDALGACSIARDLLLRAPVPTFTRSRLIRADTGKEDAPRLDVVHTHPPPEELERELIGRLEAAAPRHDVVIVADEAAGDGGIVTPAMRHSLTRLAKRHSPRTLFWVFSRGRTELFRGVFLQSSHREAQAACMRAFEEVNFTGLRYCTQAPLLFVTRGELGVQIIHLRGMEWAFAESVSDPVDAFGAGEAFATAAAALRICDDPAIAARFGNLVAGIAIMKEGAGTASPLEVQERVENARFTRSVPNCPKISRW